MASNEKANYHSNCHENRRALARVVRARTSRRGFAEDIKLKLIPIAPPVLRPRAAGTPGLIDRRAQNVSMWMVSMLVYMLGTLFLLAWPNTATSTASSSNSSEKFTRTCAFHHRLLLPKLIFIKKAISAVTRELDRESSSLARAHSTLRQRSPSCDIF